MTQMNLSLKQNQEHRDLTGSCRGGGVGGDRRLGLADVRFSKQPE